ncbi:SdpI family protein [Algoriphagus taiwanensis]|uniref:SdpI/YhfL protein family protein n=1 Tax=Algoriphagus taiwanensis TaxID=1445656 RepID=A0ABQ6Q3Q4_9BACT|nr:hypothetical protein Ataiwa_30900 [Algoriphagus taiwanensis]
MISLQFESSLFWIPLTTGLIFLLVGGMMKNYPPEEINGLYGFRTRRSMQSQEAWNFAQTKGADQMILAGKIGLLLRLLGLFIPSTGKWDLFLGLIWVFAASGGMIYSVERALIQKFEKPNK